MRSDHNLNTRGTGRAAHDAGPAIPGQGLIAERDYWLERLSGGRDTEYLLLDHARPEDYCSDKAVVDLTLEGEIYQKLCKLTADKPFLLLTALMAALKICLHKHSGKRSIVVGSPARRHDADAHQKANVLPIVDEVDDGLSFRQLLLNVRLTLLDAYARQSYPFDSLLHDLGMADVKNRCPLFDVALVLTDIHVPLPDVKQDITLTFTKRNEQVSGNLTFNNTLFDRQSMERFGDHLITVLSAALENTEIRIGELEILTDAERHQVISQWNETVADYPKNRCIQGLIEDQVERAPDNIALAFEDEQITYMTLDQRANQLGRYLLALGVKPESVVGLFLERSVAMAVGLLGILKAGGAYLPLDPAHPKERLAFMLEDTGAKVLLTQQRLLEKLPAHKARIVLMDLDWERISQEDSGCPAVRTRAENLAYVIYTSGSTGEPKGVMASHRSLVNTISALVETYKLGPGDRLLQFLSPGFDAFAEEFYPTLSNGATLVLHRQPTELSPAEVVALIERFAITALHIPPAYVGPLVEQLSGMTPGRLNSVKLFITGGENLSVRRLEQLRSLGHPGMRFINSYGPTEATITATTYEHRLETKEFGQMHRVPIGRPISNTQVYLLDQRLRPVPIGAAGELHIAGAGIARGYLNHGELTAYRFIPNPFSTEPGARLYRTGDRARYRRDGQIEFLGRQDGQVKIDGYRIELGEIEAVLAQHPDIQQAVVQVIEDDVERKRLVAHILPRRTSGDQGQPSLGELRSLLKKKLPEYMIPSSFIELNDLPLMPNGKVDRRKLSASGQVWRKPLVEYVAPRTATEEKLAAIWAALFKVERVGIHDNFQDIGGHSLLAFQLVSRLRDVFHLELPLKSIFESPTISELAILITHKLAEQGEHEKISEVLAEIEQMPSVEVNRLLHTP